MNRMFRPESPRHRRAMVVACLVLVSLLLVCLSILVLIKAPHKSIEGKRLTRRVDNVELDTKVLRPPGGLLVYLEHAGRVFSSEANFHNIIPLGLWWGAAIGAVVCLVMLGTVKSWTFPTTQRRTPVLPETIPKQAIAALCIILACAAVLRWQRLNGPLLRDEEDTLRRNVWGRHVQDADGSTYFVGNGWNRTLFENGGANNPVLFSICSRVCNEAWQMGSGRGPEWFSRMAFRLPSFVAGLGAILAIVALGWRFADGKAGIAAAALLTLHPWHIRYSVEGRGYSMAIFFAIVCWFWLATALKSGRWRDWALFAASQFALLYSFTGALYLAAAQTLIALAAIPFLKPGGGRVLIQQGRLVACCAITAVIYLILMMPCATQILNYLRKETTYGKIADPGWFSETLGAFVGGINLGIYQGEPPPEFSPVWDLRKLPMEAPALLLLIILWLALVAIGAIRLFRRDPVARTVILGIALAPVAAFVQNVFSGHYLYPWYLIYALPATILFLAAGLRLVPMSLPIPHTVRTPVYGAIVAGYIAFFLTVVPKGFYAPNDGSDLPPVELSRGANKYIIYSEGKVVQRYRAETGH
jgi:hypothetical protein